MSIPLTECTIGVGLRRIYRRKERTVAGCEIIPLSVRLSTEGKPNEDDLEDVLDHVVG